MRAHDQAGIRLTDAQSLGLFVRAERRRRGMTQIQLCAEALVSRRWLSDMEAGKPTAEIGLVFRVMDALGQMLLAAPIVLGPDDIDLDEVLRRYENPGGPHGDAHA
ncbi:MULTISPECIES: helix-turn-helix domain-containing protein [Pseudofrankia]|uniref:helix-turn-helix domain-containing protein n=1 Tax=Pseudofrankia TaxID=2994363 RepID=UPI000234B936|nr:MULTISPECIES: helix-turn-helix domain-containing protein [Pseudofrankia]